jgi:hypothetical protein
MAEPPYGPQPPYQPPHREPPYGPPPYPGPQQDYWRAPWDPQRRPEQPQWTSVLAITAFVLSLIAGFIVAIPMAIAALVGMRRTEARNRGLAIAAVAVSVVWMIGIGSFVALGLSGAFDAERDESGVIVEEGDMSLDEVRVGDCFEDDWSADDWSEGDWIDSLYMMPCGNRHDGEITAMPSLPDIDYSRGRIEVLAEQACDEEFEVYIGTAPERSELGRDVIYPTRESWLDDGDRTVVCVAFAPDGERLVGTVKGSGR